jgi:uncharacterized membrane protein (DUF485 family)
MTEVIRPRRRLAIAATFAFLVVYGAVLVLVLAPRDMIGVTPASMIDTGD